MKYIIFFVLITVSFCFAQTISHLLPQEQFRKFHKLNVDDGLSQNLVTFIHQDNQGFLWFGTAGGL
ncbi:MAG TPA: two-component regulator propeller domain-containing protein, partial [Ignavibacteriaceae bacterium]|nr:two-component regulator propeller domain-containing protein [Ignavibacteriaceae bacterium]